MVLDNVRAQPAIQHVRRDRLKYHRIGVTGELTFGPSSFTLDLKICGRPWRLVGAVNRTQQAWLLKGSRR
ncbi:hypothetical protein [Mycobacterium xenopi]|uniref:Uncharacterized protein n=1 Tax=Mycobacterium xenopi 4042 TaxID=1299334 RepID=X8DLQ1_MYCXE|nr:hypothetical protein [Mycobacterium xenopi]EUA22582.1 hypothetical protein I552_7073 [Mycobacterium xenopi 3993]EUA68981.1 hypothetical protein I553_2169 [Mycobacterium xenopi 4042]MDA3642155.1 hypothetical protein [Mycobacterium xenopi]MDA3660251.1 hypothetical protein [Mycobacterium xenopi]MDA3664786.1 hypothetical protein [Mycobacterium xenopi]